MLKNALLAAAFLAASSVTNAPMAVSSYPTPNGRAPQYRSGNNRKESSAKRHAKAKTAYKSKRAQRKKAKR